MTRRIRRPVERARRIGAPPLLLVTVIVTASPPAATQPAPRPRFFSTNAVNVCGAPTRFVADGAMWIRASTNVFTASGSGRLTVRLHHDRILSRAQVQRTRRMTGDLTRRVRRERRREVAVRIRRPGERAGRSRSQPAVAVRQRDRHRLTGSIDETAAETEVLLDMSRERVRSTSPVRRRRRDWIRAFDERLHGIRAVLADRLSHHERIRASYESVERMPGHLAQRIRRERDRALPVRIRVRTRIVHVPGRRRYAAPFVSLNVSRRAHPRRHEARRPRVFINVTVNVCGAPTRSSRRGDRDLRVDPPLRRRAGVRTRAVRVPVSVTPPTDSVVCALTIVTPVRADVR